MIKYYATDIIERARQIADLEDSSFISWNENIALLNEAWTSFYQKLIDKDEANFVKNIELHFGKNILPKDFYEVKYVGLVNGAINYTVPRRAKTEHFSHLSYDLQHNEIFINGSGNGKIVLSYYTVPKTLTYPNETYKLPFELNGTLYGTYKNNYVYGDETIHIYNKKLDVDKDTEIAFEELSNVTIGENGLFCSVTNSDTTINTLRYNSGKTVTGKNCLVDEGRLYYLNETTVEGEIVHEVKNESDETLGKLKELSEEEWDVIYLIDKDNVIYRNGSTIFNDEKTIENVKDIFVKDKVYVIKNDGLFIYTNKLELEKVVLNPEDFNYNFINDINKNTGYGITSTTNYSTDLYVCSAVDNTLLNFPNNLYFPVIAYDLAKSYKAKQGADFSQIQIKYEDALVQFYDSLSKDANYPVRIANVY